MKIQFKASVMRQQHRPNGLFPSAEHYRLSVSVTLNSDDAISYPLADCLIVYRPGISITALPSEGIQVNSSKDYPISAAEPLKSYRIALLSHLPKCKGDLTSLQRVAEFLNAYESEAISLDDNSGANLSRIQAFADFSYALGKIVTARQVREVRSQVAETNTDIAPAA